MRAVSRSFVGVVAVLLVGSGCGHDIDTVGQRKQAVAVTWTNATNVNAVGANLTKNAGGAGWNAGAVSNETFSGDGYVEFSTSENTTYKMAGLSNGDTDQNYTDIDYAINMAGNGNAYIYEGGTYRTLIGAYAANDVFRIAVEGGVVRYYQNGTLVYTSSVAPTDPLGLDTALYTDGATIINGDVTVATPSAIFQNVVGVSTNGASLTKTAGAGWNAGASTVATIDDLGYVEFTAGDNTTYKMAGLSNGDTDQNYTDIDYAVNMAGDGLVYVYEGGVRRGTNFGAYAANDVFRIAVDAAGNVTYYRNGTLFYTSTVTATFPLRVDTSLYTTGAAINDITVAPFWSNVVSVTTATNNLTKIGSLGWNAGATSTETITGDGYVEFTTAETNTYKMAGLSSGNTDQNYTDIDYAINMAGDGLIYIYENGTRRGTNYGAYSAGDVFRISSVSGVVTYARNGTVFYTSTITPATTLGFDSSLYTVGATINDVSLVAGAASTVWENKVSVSETGGNLTKVGSIGWNAGATSIASLAGDGYVEFTTAENNTYKMAGLSNGNTDSNYTDIDYAINMAGDGNAYVYEGGTFRTNLGAYAAGDIWRITNTGGTVTYSKNGQVVYTSTVTATSPLILDTSLYSVGATINNISVVDATP